MNLADTGRPTLWLINERGAMPSQSPGAILDARYSEEAANATPWPDAMAFLEQAGLLDANCWRRALATARRPC